VWGVSILNHSQRPLLHVAVSDAHDVLLVLAIIQFMGQTNKLDSAEET
jgi:hypothetical protein